MDVVGQGAGGGEVRGFGGEVWGWAGVDEEDLGAEGGELCGGLLEVVELLQAVGALIARVAAKQNQDDAALCGEGGELEGGAAGSGEDKVGGVIGYAGGGGESGDGEGEDKCGEGQQSAQAHSGIVWRGGSERSTTLR